MSLTQGQETFRRITAANLNAELQEQLLSALSALPESGFTPLFAALTRAFYTRTRTRPSII
jgi:hypothetical protein